MRKQTPRLSRSVTKFFQKEAKRIAADVAASYEHEVAVLVKDAADDAAERILRDLKLDKWIELAPDVADALRAVFGKAQKSALADLNVDDAGAVFDLIEPHAVAYAETRSAELVTKITATTRSAIRELVVQAITDGLNPSELADAIQDSGAFSQARARMISRTELAKANVQGNLDAWSESGVVVKKKWILGSEHGHEDECDDNAEQGEIDIDESFDSGDDGPPAHPNCVCDVVAITESSEDDE
jgi:hypothetical protein